jgi:DNA (cytosine-5)-methyltransferase 1
LIFVGIFENGGLLMAVSYNKLWKLMIDKKLSKTELTHIAGISTNAMAKLGRDEDVRVNILEKICIALDCNVEDIVEFIAEPTMEEK